MERFPLASRHTNKRTRSPNEGISVSFAIGGKRLLAWVWRYTRYRPLESALLVLAVALGTAAIANTLGLMEAGSSMSRRFLDTARFRAIDVMSADMASLRGPMDMGQGAVRLGRAGARPVQLTLGDVAGFRGCCPDAKYVFVTSEFGMAIGEGPRDRPRPGASQEEMRRFMEELRRSQVNIIATTPDYFAFSGLRPVKGNLFLDADVERGSRVAVLGSKLAKRLFPQGDPVGKKLSLPNLELTVIGVVGLDEETAAKRDKSGSERFAAFGPMGGDDERAYIPYSASPQAGNAVVFAPRPGGGGGTSAAAPVPEDNKGVAPGGKGALTVESIRVAPADTSRLRHLTRQLDAFVRQRYGEGLAVHSDLESYQKAERQARRGRFTLALFALAALAIAALNILQLMLVRVMQRTRQLGIAASLGATRGGIFRLFLAEAAVLGVAGGLLGLCLAPALAKFLTPLLLPPERPPMPMPPPLLLDFKVLLSAFGLAVAAAVGSGIFPARVASRVNPADALRMD